MLGGGTADGERDGAGAGPQEPHQNSRRTSAPRLTQKRKNAIAQEMAKHDTVSLPQESLDILSKAFKLSAETVAGFQSRVAVLGQVPEQAETDVETQQGPSPCWLTPPIAFCSAPYICQKDMFSIRDIKHGVN